jgi:hypothetical protein
MSNEYSTTTEWHKKQAVSLFNATWDLIDKKDRTHEDEINMIHMAHASRYHWGQIGGPLEAARGEWQISRVYAILRKGDSALYHGQESLRLCQKNNIGGFDLAFGYEAVARAYRVLDRRECDIYKDHALEAARDVGKKEDREYVLGEIEGI